MRIMKKLQLMLRIISRAKKKIKMGNDSGGKSAKFPHIIICQLFRDIHILHKYVGIVFMLIIMYDLNKEVKPE